MIALEDLDMGTDERFEWEEDEGWEDLYEDGWNTPCQKAYSAVV